MMVKGGQGEKYSKEDFPIMKVEDLVKRTDLEHFDHIPCKLIGKVNGLGSKKPFSPQDCVLTDDTGSILLDFKDPFRGFELIFGATRGKSIPSQDGRAAGWYRRSPVPHVVVESLKVQRDLYEGNPPGSQKTWATLFLIMGILGLATLAL